MNLFQLVGKFALDTDGVNKGLDASRLSADNAAASLKNMGTVAAGIVAAVTAAVTAAGKKVFDAASATADRLVEIQHSAANMQVGTAWYQEWSYIAQICGTDMGTVAKAVETMSKKVGDGSKETDKALGQLGISLEEAQAMAPEDLFETVILRLSEVEDPATKASLASDLLGSGWKSMGTIMDNTGDSIEAMKARVHDLGGVLGAEDMAKATEFQRAMVDFRTAVTGAKNAIGVELLPVLTGVVNWTTNNLIPAARNVGSFLSNPLGTISDAANRVTIDYDTGSGYIPYSDFFSNPLGVISDIGNRIKLGWRKSASGLDYVPFDEYPALLHTGEQVLTAREAEEYRRLKAMPPVNVTQYVTVPGGDPGQIAQATTAALWRWRR